MSLHLPPPAAAPAEPAGPPPKSVITVRLDPELHDWLHTESHAARLSLNLLAIDRLRWSNEFWRALREIDWEKWATRMFAEADFGGHDLLKTIARELERNPPTEPPRRLPRNDSRRKGSGARGQVSGGASTHGR